MKRLVLVAVITAFCLSLVSCGQPPWAKTLRDLEDVEVREPDSTTMWVNVDDHPNVMRLCTDGIAWATTTRNYGDAIERVPEWDDTCVDIQGEGREIN